MTQNMVCPSDTKQNNTSNTSNNQSNNSGSNQNISSGAGQNNSGNQLSDKDVAMDMLTSSKATVTSLAKVLTETTNPQLRDTLRNQLTACVNSHYRLSDIAIAKGWYNAYAEPDQQLQQNISMVQQMTQ